MSDDFDGLDRGVPGPFDEPQSSSLVDEYAALEAERAQRGELVFRPKRRRGRALVLLLLLLVLPLLAFGGVWRWWSNQLDGSKGGARMAFVVEKGWGISQIADHLDAEGVIGSSFAFQMYQRFGDHHDIQAGRYQLAEHMGVRAAATKLEAGPERVRGLRFAIIPGKWLSEIAQAAHDQLGLDAAEFVQVVQSGVVRSKYQPANVVSTEGLLFPDTYEFKKGVTAQQVVQTMVDRFDAEADRLDLAAAAAAQHRTVYQLAIIGSLIENEAVVAKDRALIASVIDNRLAKPMRLQIDATVLYAIGERKATNTAADRANPSPYNTYAHEGLPPTPISTTSAASLDAAAHPASTNFYFYVADPKTKAHVFAETFAEHQANIRRLAGK